MAKSIKSSDILEKKILNELNNGHTVGKFIVEYINDKSYASFRTFSKRLKQLVEKLHIEGHITKNELSLIEQAIKTKVTNKEPEIVFDFDKYLKDYIELFEVYKTQLEHPMNTLFLALPFILATSYKTIETLTFDEIEIINLNNSILIKLETTDKSFIKNIKIDHYYNEWKELLNLYKNIENNNRVFPYLAVSHTVFSQKLDYSLRKYVTKKTSDTKYYTLIKNCMMYKSNFCTII